MQLILKQTVPHLGAAGELVTVKSGYGRNYLLPQGLAALATARNKSQLEHNRRLIARQIATETAAAEGVAKRLNGMTLQFERLVGDDDKLFGSVTSRDIAEQLAKAKMNIDHRKIALAEPAKALGKYEVDIRVSSEVTAQLKFLVVGKETEE